MAAPPLSLVMLVERWLATCYFVVVVDVVFNGMHLWPGLISVSPSFLTGKLSSLAAPVVTAPGGLFLWGGGLFWFFLLGWDAVYARPATWGVAGQSLWEVARRGFGNLFGWRQRQELEGSAAGLRCWERSLYDCSSCPRRIPQDEDCVPHKRTPHGPTPRVTNQEGCLKPHAINWPLGASFVNGGWSTTGCGRAGVPRGAPMRARSFLPYGCWVRTGRARRRAAGWLQYWHGSAGRSCSSHGRRGSVSRKTVLGGAGVDRTCPGQRGAVSEGWLYRDPSM
jgi:hypothetical protein